MKICFVGLSKVPYGGRACDPRLAAVANILSKKMQVIILNRYSSLNDCHVEGVELNSNVLSIEIIKPRRTGKLLTVVYFLLSILREPFVLLKMRRNEKIDYLHLYSGHFFDYVYYFIISRLIGAQIVYEYVELRTAKPQMRSWYHKINNRLCDLYGAKLWDKCIVISNYLGQLALKVNPTLPIIKITPLCDFKNFSENNGSMMEQSYIMFCGSAAYFDVIKIIIDSYRASKIRQSKRLVLVLSGNNFLVDKVKTYAPEAIIKRRLPYSELISLYKNAYALLIPLRNTIEDIARFPNKICEYTAARGLIVTTGFGEVPYYFTDGINAVIADDFDIKSLADKLDKIEEGEYDIESIKKNCYKTGLDNFSIESYENKLIGFLK